ncbi:unnamed protein product [Caenorhabditis auriculariae]|uniref:Uncharacterized protein n=1 Tax=Caenorhabditis auriculariae TaxID=2777116 RepID=A0A8S1HLF8_9PELO|nr:unnamed protein product [Caenorhabditis auriculariae]
MATNRGFSLDEATTPTSSDENRQTTDNKKKSVDVGTSTTRIIISPGNVGIDEEQASCCSWNRICDVFGTRQSSFISALRPVRGYLIRMQESLKIFQCELERNLKTKPATETTFRHVHTCILEINDLISRRNLNIPPDESTMLRSVVYELVVLARIIEEVANLIPRAGNTEKLRARAASMVTLIAEPVVRKHSDGEVTRDVATGSNTPAIDERSLKERITRVCDMTEKLIRYVDKKTERRWWLRDLINFLQVAVKVALFISAAISVAYHKEQTTTIITLVITIIQGVVEVLDQYFLKNTKPEDIHLSVLTSMTTNAKS